MYFSFIIDRVQSVPGTNAFWPKRRRNRSSPCWSRGTERRSSVAWPFARCSADSQPWSRTIRPDWDRRTPRTWPDRREIGRSSTVCRLSDRFSGSILYIHGHRWERRNDGFEKHLSKRCQRKSKPTWSLLKQATHRFPLVSMVMPSGSPTTFSVVRSKITWPLAIIISNMYVYAVVGTYTYVN